MARRFACLLVIGVCLGACGSGTSGGADSTEQSTDAATGTAATIEFRPVLECEEGTLTSSPTPTSQPDPSGEDLLATADGLLVCRVGPPGADQGILERGSAETALDSNGQWVVTVDLRPEGQDAWDALAGECFEHSATCKSGQIAIVLDGVIQTAPSVQSPEFPTTIQISGSFTENEVRDIARVLNDVST